jgi:hypothetical protein
MTGLHIPVEVLNLIRAVMGIHNRRFNLFVKCSSSPSLHTRYFGTSVRISKLVPKVRKCGSPFSETARMGHGFGFAFANLRKSCANTSGKMTRFAWTFPGANPVVGPVKLPARMRNRSASPLRTASIGVFMAVPCLSLRTLLFIVPRTGIRARDQIWRGVLKCPSQSPR